MRRFLTVLGLASCLLTASSGGRTLVDPVRPHAIVIKASPLVDPAITLSPELRFLRGWALNSRDEDFGGLSGLITDGVNFTALSDKGLFVHFTRTDDEKIGQGRVAPLPKGCAVDGFKTDRDTEALARDPNTGRVWISFEWHNAICKAGADLRQAQGLTYPAPMKGWPRATGPEAMTRLADGRFLVLAERPGNGAFEGPALVFDGDPTVAGQKVTPLTYKLPVDYFRPTDAATLPDGRVLILHRNFKPPFRFRAKLAVMDALPSKPGAKFSSRVIASFDEKGLTENLEGIAISQEGGRTFVWILSDDNYLWLQQTYLLQLELVDTAKVNSGRDGSN